MNKNVPLALLCGTILILGSLSILTGQRIFVFIGMFIAATTKLWFNFFPIKNDSTANEPTNDKSDNQFLAPSKTKKPKRFILGKVDLAAIIFGCLITSATGLILYFVSCAIFPPNVYFYLGQDSYAHNVFPITWELFNEVLIGLVGGYFVAIYARLFPLANVFIAAIFIEVFSLLFRPNSLSEDPLWYSAVTNTLFFSFFIIGGLIGKVYRTKHLPDLAQDIKIRSLTLHLIWCGSITITLFFVGMFVDRRITYSPPENIIQQMEEMATNGDKTAEEKVGNYYYLGPSKDFNKAAEYYTQAAQQGDAYSQIMLGRMLFRGEGVKVDYLSAYEWLALGQKKEKFLSVLGDLEIAKSKLSPEEVVMADKWLADWKPVSK